MGVKLLNPKQDELSFSYTQKIVTAAEALAGQCTGTLNKSVEPNRVLSFSGVYNSDTLGADNTSDLWATYYMGIDGTSGLVTDLTFYDNLGGVWVEGDRISGLVIYI